MSSKRRLRKNGCTGKVVLRSIEDGYAALIEMRRRGRDTTLLRPYRCGFHAPNRPRHFHVGHKFREDWAYIA